MDLSVLLQDQRWEYFGGTAKSYWIKEGKLKESNEILLQLVNRYPDDSIINYQCAWSFDALGLEKKAIQYYRKAISLRLPDQELQGAYLGLGSTYRTLGQYKESKEVFEEGLVKFPRLYTT